MEKVTIIIPIYNGEKFLEETLQSCFCQEYEDLEIILLNDASSDNTDKIVRKYVDRENVIYIVNKKNEGLMKNLNIGISKAKGTKILVLGQDDILPMNYIKKAMECFDGKCGFVFCNPLRIDENGIPGNYIYASETLKDIVTDIYFEIAKNNIIPSTGLIMDKQFLVKCGGYEEKYRNYGEWMLWIKMLALCEGRYIDTVHTKYRTHTDNITSKQLKGESANKDLVLHQYYLECQKKAIQILPIIWSKKIYLIFRYIYKVMQYVLTKVRN